MLYKKNTLFKSIFIFIVLISTSDNIFSQEIKVTQDLGTWMGLVIEKEATKNLDFSLEQQVRLYTNSTEFDDYLIDFGSKYKMNKNFKIGGHLRYTYDAKRRKETAGNYRYNLDFYYKGILNDKFRLQYRLRYQQTFVNLLSEYNLNKIHYSGIRNKIKLKYKINENNQFYLSGELFRLNQIFREPYFNLLRFYLGDKIKTKIGDFDCSLGYEKELNSNLPLSFLFVKVIYKIKL